MTATDHRTVRLCHLYPKQMNIYADRGNIAVLRHRLGWRGYELETTNLELGDNLRPGQHDLYYLGGGQDRDQELVANDLTRNAAALRSAADEGAAMLFVCGGIQLAGSRYRTTTNQSLKGVGVFDLETEAGTGRLVGDILIEANLAKETRPVVGYENHVGRTHLGSDCEPLGTVVHGYGNNGTDDSEGAVRDHAIGTYIHGPLLPKNPWLADILIRWSLGHRTGEQPTLEPLDDTTENLAHAAATTRTGLKR